MSHPSMASKLLQPPIPASHVVLQAAIPIKTMVMRTHSASSFPLTRYSAFRAIFSGRPPRSIYAIRVQEPSSSSDIVGEQLSGEDTSLAEIKTDLYQIVEGINRGIFGVPSATKSEIEALVEQLEAQNPNPDPTLHLDRLGGTWKLLYSTITVLGSKRTKLGLRDFINLGDLLQTIDVSKGKAINVIEFNARGLKLLSGQLKIEASFKIASRSRVAITYENSTITPDQLMNVFRKNYDMLLAIFNPEGWLEITYVDETMRIGRDDKGNIFILERELP